MKNLIETYLRLAELNRHVIEKQRRSPLAMKLAIGNTNRRSS